MTTGGPPQDQTSRASKNSKPNLKQNTGPVSYTHLDVYKRQEPEGDSSSTNRPGRKNGRSVQQSE